MKVKFKIGDIVKMFDPPSERYRFIVGIDPKRYYFYYMEIPDMLLAQDIEVMEQSFVKVKE